MNHKYDGFKWISSLTIAIFKLFECYLQAKKGWEFTVALCVANEFDTVV